VYIASCPLRVSLFGGSTDNPYFVEKYGKGSVISFTSNLKTYITLHEDKLGYNMQGCKYIVNYSKREETEFIGDIKNELVRIVLNYFGCLPLTVSMTSDAYSQGSGLASSSSYIISLIKCISMFMDLHLTDIEICELALQLEQEMNPYCGYQDPYGCGIGGFKKIDFEKGGIIKYDFLSTELFKHYDAHLVFTGITRNSKNVLKDVTENIDKSLPLLKTVDDAYYALKRKTILRFWNS
jgi:D-glycero-alpha-D-manno-heptose-7-phosphate kinase